MRFTIFAQVYSIVVIISLGGTGEVKSKSPGEVTPNTAAEDKLPRQPGEEDRHWPRKTESHSSESAKPKDSKKLAKSTTSDQSGRKSSSVAFASENQSPNEASEAEDLADTATFVAANPSANRHSRKSVRGVFRHDIFGTGSFRPVGTVQDGRFSTGTFGHNHESEKEMENSFNHAARLVVFQNTGCSDGKGENGQVMFSTMRSLSSNVESLLEFVQSTSTRQSQFQTRMDAYETRLFGIDQKLDMFLSEAQSTSQNIRQVVQTAEQTNSMLSEMTEVETRQGQIFDGVGNGGSGYGAEFYQGLDTLRGILSKISNQTIVLTHLQQRVSSIAQNINGLYEKLDNGGGSSVSTGVMQNFLETIRQNIIVAFKSEMASIVDRLASLSTNIASVGSLGDQLRVSLESLYNLGSSLSTVSQMVSEIRARVFEGCTVHVRGGAGTAFQLDKAAKHNQAVLSKRKESNQRLHEESYDSVQEAQTATS